MYRTREDEVRAAVSKDEAIRRIKQYGAEYDPDLLAFDAWDQLLACESIAESTPVREIYSDGYKKTDDAVGLGGVYGGCKCNTIAELFKRKESIILELRGCTSRTSVVRVGSLLEDLFADYPSNKAGYWFDVARYYTPRVINWVLIELLKLSSPDHETVRNPASYFTFLTKTRTKRRRYERKRHS